MILCSTTAIGFRASEGIHIRAEQLRQLRRVMILIRGEVMYHKASVNEAMRSVGEKIEQPFAGILYTVAEEVEKKDGRMFGDIWKSAMQGLKSVALSQKDLRRLEKFGEDFGYMQKEMQISAFDLYIEELEQTICEAEKKKEENSRLYRTLGIMGGILIVIIIV